MRIYPRSETTSGRSNDTAPSSFLQCYRDTLLRISFSFQFRDLQSQFFGHQNPASTPGYCWIGAERGGAPRALRTPGALFSAYGERVSPSAAAVTRDTSAFLHLADQRSSAPSSQPVSAFALSLPPIPTHNLFISSGFHLIACHRIVQRAGLQDDGFKDIGSLEGAASSRHCYPCTEWQQ